MEADPFQRFAESLTPDERRAVESWLGMGYTIIRQYQRDGTVPSAYSVAHVDSVLQAFNRALEKAVICNEHAFRGLSASRCLPGDFEYVHSFVSGSGSIPLTSHDSATVSEELGRSFCRLDEEKDLGVLLRIQPRTARYLRPFSHKSKDEEEVVLLKGSRYRRTAVARQADPKPGFELWEVELIEEEIA